MVITPRLRTTPAPHLFQLLQQPVRVLQQVLHAVHQAPVRPQPQLVHDVVHGDEVAHVEGHVVAEVLRGRVEVRHVEAAAVLRPQEEAVLLQDVRVGALSGAGGPVTSWIVQRPIASAWECVCWREGVSVSPEWNTLAYIKNCISQF